MEEINYGHKPVLLHECLDALAIKPDGVYLDGRWAARATRWRSSAA